ncbi:hypothetical protein [Rhizobium sp. EC-SD404]|uniref:hypothetical protein n=1 Tax=Rhizobium sp. EC-SD404 TaxID=2038389 RepID=UPI0012584C6C|nr:hypothetical protein [Rhizobium sp. EC-SD404]VVT04764.1 exported hypothetical protein [Rhizobium sp. EC-SD404]
MFRIILITAVAWPMSLSAQDALHHEDFIHHLNETLAAEGLTEVTVSEPDPSETDAAFASADTEDDIQRSLNVIGRVGEMIAEDQCAEQGRPSSITYSLSASFQILVGVETGTEVTWELDGLCERMKL